MTAMIGSTDCPPADLTATRLDLDVGPHDGPPPGDPAFFRDGRARALAAAAATPIRRTS